jgi:hypothetical protein
MINYIKIRISDDNGKCDPSKEKAEGLGIYLLQRVRPEFHFK